MFCPVTNIYCWSHFMKRLVHVTEMPILLNFTLIIEKGAFFSVDCEFRQWVTEKVWILSMNFRKEANFYDGLLKKCNLHQRTTEKMQIFSKDWGKGWTLISSNSCWKNKQIASERNPSSAVTFQKFVVNFRFLFYSEWFLL